jgi:hypothetical protein
LDQKEAKDQIARGKEERVEKRNEKKGIQDSPDPCSQCLKQIDSADGHGPLLLPIGIQTAAQGKHHSVRDSQRGQKRNRPEEYLQKAGSFPNGKPHQIPEAPDTIDGQGKQDSDEELKKSITSFLKPPLLCLLSPEPTARRIREKPVGQNDGNGKFISRKDHQKFADDHHLSDGKSEAHEKESNEEGGLGKDWWKNVFPFRHAGNYTGLLLEI